MTHTCHAHACERPIAPRLLFCAPHWRELPKSTQRAIWAEYRPGQERDKKPSLRYLAVQRLAVAQSAFRPNDEAAAREAARYLVQAEAYAARAVAAGEGDPLEGLRPA